MTVHTQGSILFGANRLTIEDVIDIANGAPAALNSSPEFTSKIDRGAAFLERLLKEEGVIYGVTTGYGGFLYCGYSSRVGRRATTPLNPFPWLRLRRKPQSSAGPCSTGHPTLLTVTRCFRGSAENC